MEKRIGKIEYVKFGYGGYQDAMFGISITLSSKKDCWGVCDFKGAWGMCTKVTERTKWTEDDRRKQFADTMIFIDELMLKAKVTDVNDLRGVPVEVTFEGNTLKEWRILEEVL